MIKVMIADDQELIRQSLEFMLGNKSDIKIVGTAKDGEEAVRLTRSHMPDVILMDIRMPKMDGLQCIKIIKESHPHIKILVLTTFDDDEYIFNALKDGSSGYLLKGMSVDELVKAIRTVVNGGALINPDIATKVVNLFSQMAHANYTVRSDNKILNEFNKNEMRILKLVGHGMSNKEIAYKLNFSEGTTRNYISSILSKLGLRDRTQVAIFAVQSGLLLNSFE